MEAWAPNPLGIFPSAAECPAPLSSAGQQRGIMLTPWKNGEVTGREPDNLDSNTGPASCQFCVVNRGSLPQFPHVVIEKDE